MDSMVNASADLQASGPLPKIASGRYNDVGNSRVNISVRQESNDYEQKQSVLRKSQDKYSAAAANLD